MKNADLILVPYNFLICKTAAKAIPNKILKNSIIIFDEAHNIQETAQDGE